MRGQTEDPGGLGTPGTPDVGPGPQDEVDDDEEEEVPSPPRTFTKARPLSERENKFTSTLRRLSTVRKRNKAKRQKGQKDQKCEMASNGDSGIEAPVTTPSGELRPASTTSRESEGEAALTSGYFRYIY